MSNLDTTNKQLTLGLVQDVDENLFSPWIVAAYKNLESESVKLVIVGGSPLYKTQSEKLNCKNVIFVSLPDNNDDLSKVMKTFDIFVHGSINGENNFKYIEMAQELGIPIVSHFAQGNNGHVATIGESGVLHGDFNSYILKFGISWPMAYTGNGEEKREKKYFKPRKVPHIYPKMNGSWIGWMTKI